ncbi:MAG: CRTAC1 family protein [Aestuariivirga sp.]|uniref:CRTAC1 family protein n=1 Tax=Aestuariivirga sp. TaxID=2650926 RepID=UPI0025C25AA4|nr:CRTAC1 family protein [Aestuariivirga sp.]MCA3562395.1 CRTAC1 family protein [Aestuariivirga sp.]
MRTFAIASATLLISARAALAGGGPVVPSFVEETKTSGIASVYSGEWQYMVGGGAAAFDCNDDGFEDVLIAGGGKPATFYLNKSTHGGALKFEKHTSGLEFDAMTGAYPLDADGDGIMDVVALRVGENMLMKGKGNCQFARANEDWGFAGGDGWSTAYAATWENGNDWPTIAIGNYIDRTEELEPWGSCTPNVLQRPRDGGKGFAPPLELKPSYCPLSMLFTDWNNSGTPDLRMANDREYYEGGQEQMWQVRPGQPPKLYRKEDGWAYLRIWGMGLAGYDLDGDGFQEYAITSMADNKLQTLKEPPKDGSAPKPTYKDVAWPRGVTAHRPFMGTDLKPSTAWHIDFQDVNNDGLADLFIAKGNVSEMPDFAMKDPNNLLVQGKDGKFIEMADKAGVASTETSRGAALADFNLDGLVDLLVVNRNAPTQVWRNVTPAAGNWIEVKLRQPGGNVNAIGAMVEVKTPTGRQTREVVSGGGHVSGQSGWVHFGIGDAKQAEVRVRWPGEDWGKPMTLGANRFAVLDKTKAEAEAWTPNP